MPGPDDKPTPASELGEIAFQPQGGRRIKVLAHGGHSERHLVQSEQHLYWTDQEDGTVTRLPKDGGVPLILAFGQRHPGPLVLAGGWLWWATRDCIVRMPAEGGDVEVLAEGQESPEALAVHGETVVWVNFGDGLATGTVRMKAPGGPVVTLATKQKQPNAVALDAAQIYWVNGGIKRPSYFKDGAVVRMPRDGGKKRFVIAKDQELATSLAIDDEHLYWTTGTNYDNPREPTRIWRRRKAGGKIEMLASWVGSEHTMLAVDDAHVYALECWPGTIHRVPKAGGPLEQIMRGERVKDLPDGLVVDDRCVYWTVRDSRTAGGAVFKMGK